MDSQSRKRLKLSNTWMQGCAVLCITVLFACIIFFVQSLFDAQARSDQKKPLNPIHKIDASRTLSLARTAQAILSLSTTFALQNTFQYLQWAMISRPQGLSYTSMLSLSTTTGALGMMNLIRSLVANGSSKAWAIMRACFTTMLWISTLVLFYGISVDTVYETALSYNVTAGVGPFNGSLVPPFLGFLESLAPDYPYTTVPYNYYAMAGSLVAYSTFGVVAEPVYCKGDGCFSYLLTGGLEMAMPDVPQGYPECPLVKIASSPAVQMEFTHRKEYEGFNKRDCSVYGAPGTPIGIELCLAQGPKWGGLQAAIFSCTNGTDGAECLGDRPLPGITYGINLFSRQASIIASQSNHSIMGVEDLTEAKVLPPIDLLAYKLSLDWLLNFTAANLPAATSIAANFAMTNDQALDPSTDGVLSRNFQSILAFPLWLFNANNWGNIELKANTITPTLPPEFYTTATIVAPYSKIGFNRTMFYLFIAFQGLALSLIWAVLIWIWVRSTPLPYISSFPLFDAAFKLEKQELAQDQAVVFKAEDTHVLELVGQERVFVRGV
ncbi:hypothetical protein PG993_012510 [Apiospora rasikravindrae]|uniref:Uncharacterized protein n=1 Tax=Apiospora rasikravindrae TaxID=990691 RepID=A0ABR1S2M7_9PEZI